ncbi:MAG: SGNH/GDSL hydrolase family protein [Chloroflexi bacterium]|nr:SGNH/GDSL hydrolase family protein [Chloroflexota bacterium]
MISLRLAGWALVALLALGWAWGCSEGGGEAGSRTSSSRPGAEAKLGYIALGDSLSVGVGASFPGANGFVPLVLHSLGEEYELINLSHSGDTSSDLLDHGHLSEAIAEIAAGGGESDGVRVVTLEIGGNDLLRIYFALVISGICPSLDVMLATEECRDALAMILADYAPNLAAALDGLLAADPSLRIVLLTLYNPLSGFLPVEAELADLALEGLPDTPFPGGLNDVIRAEAAERGIIVADLHPLFDGRALELMSSDFVHPNDAGHRVMADAVIAALEDAR